MRRLVLVRHAVTASMRGAAFPRSDEPLAAAGAAAARAIARRIGHGDGLSSPAACARETAVAAGIDARTDPALAECDFGRWGGRTLAEVCAQEPEAAEAWLRDPWARPHGGESLGALAGRVGRWLDEHAQRDGRTIAITHATVVKAAVVHALDVPLEGLRRVDAAPLRVTELHARDGRWTVRAMNAALTP